MNLQYWIFGLIMAVILIPRSAFAVPMNSQSYRIESGRINTRGIASAMAESENYQTDPLGIYISDNNQDEDSSGEEGDPDSGKKHDKKLTGLSDGAATDDFSDSSVEVGENKIKSEFPENSAPEVSEHSFAEGGVGTMKRAGLVILAAFFIGGGFLLKLWYSWRKRRLTSHLSTT